MPQKEFNKDDYIINNSVVNYLLTTEVMSFTLRVLQNNFSLNFLEIPNH